MDMKVSCTLFHSVLTTLTLYCTLILFVVFLSLSLLYLPVSVWVINSLELAEFVSPIDVML